MNRKKCVKINIYILWGNLLKINYVKIWKIILILNYFNVYNHIFKKLSDLVVSRVVYFLSRHNVMLHHCARSAPRHLRHDVAKGDNVYIYSSFCFNSSVIVTSPSDESGRVFCQARKNWKFTMKRKRSEMGFDTEEFQRVHGILWNAIYVNLCIKTRVIWSIYFPREYGGDLF